MDPGIFVSFYLVLSLFNSLKGGSNGFIADKNFTYTLPRIQKSSIIFRGGGGVQLFPGGGGEGSKC